MTNDNKSLTYVEVDFEGCSNVYGRSPCTAGAENWFFENNHNGFTANQANWILNTEYSSFESIGTEGQLFSPSGLAIDGATHFKILIDAERVNSAATLPSRVYWSTSGHGFTTSYYKDFPMVPVGTRGFIVLDMRAPDAGGDDWITSTITQLRFDLARDVALQEWNIYSIQVQAEHKCFNTLATCQDRANYNTETQTFRFAQDTEYLPQEIDCLPYIASVNLSTAQLKLGESLGTRASLTVTFNDRPHPDTGLGGDKYVREREYNPFEQGTFFGKWRIRRPFVRSKKIRLIRGLLGQTLEQMDTRHYLLEDFNGPTPKGVFTFTAKDVLKFADSDRAQCPSISPGHLASGITDSATTANLLPSGIGNSDYPASGEVAIGGEEICTFTRTNDQLTLVRAQKGTTAVAHDAQDRVQLVQEYSSEPAAIIRDLLVNYADVPSEYIDLAAWQTETAAHLNRVYATTIAEPTSVKKLVNELIEQAALVLWWDDRAQLLRLRVLRSIPTDAALFDRNNTVMDSLRIKDNPGKRLTDVWTYYGIRNFLRPIDEPDNFRSVRRNIDPEAQSDYGSAGIKKIFSRWIAAFAATTAERLNDILLARYVTPPRTFDFIVYRYGDDVQLGNGYQISGTQIQDATGAETTAPIQVTNVKESPALYSVHAEEILIQPSDAVDLTNRTIIVDANTNDFDLRVIHDNIYPAPTGTENPPVTLTCIINAGVIVGSTAEGVPAFTAGRGSDWPGTFTVNVEVRGRIQGKGGDGGRIGSSPQLDGRPGGDALYVRENIGLVLNSGSGEIWGGGGGGGAAADVDITVFVGGGGGAGQIPGPIYPTTWGDIPDATPGTTEAGGAGVDVTLFASGNGGNPGLAGTAAAGALQNAGSGGAAGVAIDGVSFVTKTGTGDIRGNEVN